MVPWIYDFLLLIMLFVLYRAGKSIAKTGKIWSLAGFSAIITYTLNEGLRYGRGIDYNMYGKAWDEFITGETTTWTGSFLYIARFFAELQLPWQCMIMFMSFIFITGSLYMLKETKDILPIALPLFCVFTLGDAENLLRWYTGFSFVMIGMMHLIRKDRNYIIKYLSFSLIACSFHLALLPIPILFFLIFQIKKPIFSPIVTLVLFFLIAFSFKTEVMMRFSEIANLLSTVSIRFESYSNNMEYWLTSGNDGIEKSALPDIQDLLFLVVTTILGGRIVDKYDHRYVFFYNLYIVGLLFLPLGRQIELLGRFDAVFYFFRAIIASYIIKYAFIDKNKITIPLFAAVSMLIILNNAIRRPLTAPFKYPDRYLYMWNSEGRNYDTMLQMWLDGIHKQYEGS